MTSGWLNITPKPRPHTTRWALSTPPLSSPYCLSPYAITQIAHGCSLVVPSTTIPLLQFFSWLTPSLHLGVFSNVTSLGMTSLSILSNPFPHLSSLHPTPCFPFPDPAVFVFTSLMDILNYAAYLFNHYLGWEWGLASLASRGEIVNGTKHQPISSS